MLFLGGWGVPFAWFGWDDLDGVADWMNVGGPLILFTKMLVLTFLIMWVRFSVPRFREDQLQRFAWKLLIPLALANIVVTAILKVAMPQSDADGKPKMPGLLKGMGVTLRTLARTVTEGAETVQYPHEKEAPPTRARGVIALREDNCTVCMLCARSCPDWCIYIEGHKKLAPPRRRRRQAPLGEPARPLRHRLRAVHVLRHLRRGVPVRRPVLEPRVRVLRAPHRRPAARQGQARRVDGDGARGPELEAGAEKKK